MKKIYSLTETSPTSLLHAWKHCSICRLLCLFFLSSTLLGTAQVPTYQDSLSLSPASDTLSLFQTHPSLRNLPPIVYGGLPLIVSGLIMKNEDKNFRELRQNYLPRYHYHLDDYLQYAPAGIMLGLKALGVPGRSSWNRMLVSDAFSACLMAGVVNTMKYTSQVERPDGSNRHSFPSGHTATAFMTATMLSKEYGHINPWIGIGAYSIATTTGLMRMANNKHWLSDVLTGAGIGIISTELGYYLADLLFKEKGIRLSDQSASFDRWDKPTFVSLFLGMNLPLNDFHIDDQQSFHISSGCSAGVEGAYFFSPYWGLGGRFAVNNAFFAYGDRQPINTRFDSATLSAGGYFSYPLSTYLSIGSKLLGSYIHYPDVKLSEDGLMLKRGYGMNTGLSLTFRAKQHYGIRLFTEYNLFATCCKARSKTFPTISLGSSFVVLL